jgi:hypothetical protein
MWKTKVGAVDDPALQNEVEQAQQQLGGWVCLRTHLSLAECHTLVLCHDIAIPFPTNPPQTIVYWFPNGHFEFFLYMFGRATTAMIPCGHFKGFFKR